MRRFADTSRTQVISASLASCHPWNLPTGGSDLTHSIRTPSYGPLTTLLYRDDNGVQVYEEAGRAYAALEEHLRANSARESFFFGIRPSSLDAAIFAHVAFHHGAPVSAPELRQKVGSDLWRWHNPDSKRSANFNTGYDFCK